MIAMFRQHTLLAERAAFNGIDISQYMEYPPQTIKKILKALEDGYSKKGIDQWVENRKDLERYLDDLAPTENAAIFAHDLLDDINLPQRIPDMRKQIRKWDLIFPGDSYLGWSSDSIHFTKDKLQRYVDENDPEAGKNTSLFIWADSILQNRNDPIFLLKSLKSFELANSELCYGMHTAEYLACYIIFSGYEPEKTVALCGHVASAMGLENKDIYQSMLEAVSMAIAATNGIPAGDIYYKSHKSRIRYKIHEAGFLKKKLIVEELIEKGKLFQNLTEAIKQKENSFDALLRTGAGHNELVLWHSIMEYTNDERINQGVCADREKQQYAEELSHFLEKGGHDAGIDDADRNHIYKLI